MAFLDTVFNRHAGAPPPTHIRERVLMDLLGTAVGEGAREGRMMGDGDDPDAGYLFRNGSDGIFELGVTSSQKGKTYNSYVKAERISATTFEIKAIVLDNELQPLTNAKEIRAALEFIGDQARNVYFNRMPGIHSPWGKFSTLGRFVTRMRPLRGEPPGLGL
jgi:hypothetical protein